MTRWMGPTLAAALCFAAPQALAQGAADYAAAVSAPDRPAEMVELDASRHPAEILAFLGLKKDMVAADVMSAAGYYSEIMAHIVGPKGRVIALDPAEFVGPDVVKAWETLPARVPNASHGTYPFTAFAPTANGFDFALFHLAYHDVYWSSEKYKVQKTDPAAFVAALFAAMKPGGIVGVVDHVGDPGDARATVDKLHRIDPEQIKRDFIAAGFVLEAESDLLRVASDDHTKPVFAPEVRGKTDRVVYRFRKPA